MNNDQHAAIYSKSLRLSPEAIEWLKQQSNVSQAINQLICDRRRSEARSLNQQQEFNRTEDLDLARQQIENLQLQNDRQRVENLYQQSEYQEQIAISQEQVKTLQQQLQDEVDCNQVYHNQLDLLKNKLKALIIQQLSWNKSITVESLNKYLESLAQQVVMKELAVNGDFIVVGSNRLAVRTAFTRFITLLLH